MSELAAKSQTKARCAAYKGYKDGSVDFLGEQILQLSGYDKQTFDARRMKWTDIVVEADKQSFKTAFVQALKSDKTYMREYRIKTRAENIIWIQEWGQIVLDERGELEYVTGILMDITKQKLEEIAQLKSEQKTGRYLLFSLSGQDFGINILTIRHLFQNMAITPLAQAPAFVKGVINYRDKVIPVLDLGLKLGLEGLNYSECSCTIILEVVQAGETKKLGILVDSVSDVVYLKGTDIDDSPEYIAQFQTGYILGIAKIENKLKIILDTDKVLIDAASY